MMRLTEAFVAIADLASALGVGNLKARPGCWEHKVDEDWWIYLNAHGEPTRCSQGVEVPPYSAFIMFRGLPAGVIDPGGGVIAASRDANEDAFIAALRAAAGAPGVMRDA